MTVADKNDWLGNPIWIGGKVQHEQLLKVLRNARKKLREIPPAKDSVDGAADAVNILHDSVQDLFPDHVRETAVGHAQVWMQAALEVGEGIRGKGFGAYCFEEWARDGGKERVLAIFDSAIAKLEQQAASPEAKQ